MENREFQSNLARVDIAIEKLTLVSTNIDKLISIHDERLKQNEKQINNIEATLEKRREIIEETVSTIYETMRKDDKDIAEELNKFKIEINAKLSKIERSVWLFSGAISVITFFLTYGQSFIKILTAAAK